MFKITWLAVGAGGVRGAVGWETHPGTLAFLPVPTFLHHPQPELVWLKQRGGLWAGRQEMPTESGQWDCSRLGCPSVLPGSPERTEDRGVIGSRGSRAKNDGGGRGAGQGDGGKVQALTRAGPSTICMTSGTGSPLWASRRLLMFPPTLLLEDFGVGGGRSLLHFPPSWKDGTSTGPFVGIWPELIIRGVPGQVAGNRNPCSAESRLGAEARAGQNLSVPAPLS